MMELLIISFYLNTSHLHQHKLHSLHTLIPLSLMTNNQLIMAFPYVPTHHHPLTAYRFPHDAPNGSPTNRHILMTMSVVQPGTMCLLSHLTLHSLLHSLLPQVNRTLLPPIFLMMFILLFIQAGVGVIQNLNSKLSIRMVSKREKHDL
ncbi:hypothetical protein AMTRI_Chr04g186940 [Amborella trichopoda]